MNLDQFRIHTIQDKADPKTKPGPLPLVNAEAPFVYFDGASSIAHNDGIAKITLEAVREVSRTDGTLEQQRVIVGYLRCGFGALQNLKNAINGIELLLSKTGGDEVN